MFTIIITLSATPDYYAAIRDAPRHMRELRVSRDTLMLRCHVTIMPRHTMPCCYAMAAIMLC